MASSEVMTSSTHSFAYSYRLVKKCFVKICETSKCHNFLIFQPIFIRFSLLCLEIFTLSSEIKLNLLWSSSLKHKSTDKTFHKTYQNNIHLMNAILFQVKNFFGSNTNSVMFYGIILCHYLRTLSIVRQVAKSPFVDRIPIRPNKRTVCDGAVFNIKGRTE